MDFIGVFLNKEEKTPLYYQLYNHLVRQIRGGGAAAGEKLPGKRTAAVQLGVSINTVDEAYQMLAAEGYVQARPRSGFVVSRLEQLVPPPAAAPVEAFQWGKMAKADKAKALPELKNKRWEYSFSSGGQDDSLFPLKTWNRLLREVLAGEDCLFARGEGLGDEVLRRAIADYLRGYRGVRCAAGDVVVGAGLEVLCGMLVRLFPEGLFGVEDPGYPKTGHILQNMGLALQPVEVDGEGMRADALKAAGAQVAYLTPSHQFPTGVVMPVGRRLELLRWANQEGGMIIEDDYDSEFRFDGRPLPCMQGLDEAGRVVYAGTFSRSLAPGLRAAYMVLPPDIMGQWRRRYGDYACTVSRPEQHTLARLMKEGHFSRSLNRVRSAYKDRRDRLLESLRHHLPPASWQAENIHTGLYFVLRLPGRDAVALAEQGRAKGLRLHALDEYRHQSAEKTTTADALIIGYGGLQMVEIEPAVEAFARLLR